MNDSQRAVMTWLHGDRMLMVNEDFLLQLDAKLQKKSHWYVDAVVVSNRTQQVYLWRGNGGHRCV